MKPPPVQVFPGLLLVSGPALTDLYYLASCGIRAAARNGYPTDRFEGIRRAIRDADVSPTRHDDVAEESLDEDSEGQDDEWIDVIAAADLLGLSRRQVQRLAKDGLGKRRGSSWTFSSSLVLAHKQFREGEKR